MSDWSEKRGNPLTAAASGVIITKTPKKQITSKAPKITREGPIVAEREFVKGLVLLLAKENRVWLLQQFCAQCGDQLVEEDSIRADNHLFCISCWSNLYGNGDTEVDINIPGK